MRRSRHGSVSSRARGFFPRAGVSDTRAYACIIRSRRRVLAFCAWAHGNESRKQRTWRNNNCSGMVAIKARDLSRAAVITQTNTVCLLSLMKLYRRALIICEIGKKSPFARARCCPAFFRLVVPASLHRPSLFAKLIPTRDSRRIQRVAISRVFSRRFTRTRRMIFPVEGAQQTRAR